MRDHEQLQFSIRRVLALTTLTAIGFGILIQSVRNQMPILSLLAICYLCMLASVSCFRVSGAVLTSSERRSTNYLALVVASIGSMLAVASFVGVVIAFSGTLALLLR